MDVGLFYLKTLGHLALHDSRPGGRVILSNKKPLAVLAILATMPGSTASREYLADLLWPGVGHDRARRSLRQALYQLSKRVGQDLVVASDITLSLNRELLTVDLWAFDRAMEERDYARAVELCAGPFLPGLERKAGGELSHWIEAQNERLGAALQVAYVQMIADAVRAGNLESAVEHARANAARNPLDEGGQVLLVRTLRAAGRDAEALQSYHGYRKLLAGELGDEPGEELERSAARVREALLAPLEGVLGSELNGLAAALVDARQPKVSRPRWQAAAIGGAGGAAVLAIGLLAWAALFEGGRATLPLDDLHGTIMAVLPGTGLVEFELRGRSVEERRGPSVFEPQFYVPSPDGSRVANVIDAPDGVNTAVRDLGSGAVKVIAEGPDDEYPVAWSPDGRYLLYTYGRLLDDGLTYVYRLGIHDMVTGVRRALAGSPFVGSSRSAAWSPDGTRIAFIGKEGVLPRLFVVDFDGRGERAVSPTGLWAEGATWSPDGTHLAFAGRSTAFLSVYVVRPDGSELRPVSSAAADYRQPLWMSDRVLATVSERVGGRDIWAVDVVTGEERRLTNRGDIAMIVHPFRGDKQGGWIDDLAIQPDNEVVTSGQRVELHAVLTAARGETVPSELVPIRWSLVERSPAELDDAGDGLRGDRDRSQCCGLAGRHSGADLSPAGRAPARARLLRRLDGGIESRALDRIRLSAPVRPVRGRTARWGCFRQQRGPQLLQRGGFPAELRARGRVNRRGLGANAFQRTIVRELLSGPSRGPAATRFHRLGLPVRQRYDPTVRRRRIQRNRHALVAKEGLLGDSSVSARA